MGGGVLKALNEGRPRPPSALLRSLPLGAASLAVWATVAAAPVTSVCHLLPCGRSLLRSPRSHPSCPATQPAWSRAPWGTVLPGQGHSVPGRCLLEAPPVRALANSGARSRGWSPPLGAGSAWGRESGASWGGRLAMAAGHRCVGAAVNKALPPKYLRLRRALSHPFWWLL